MIREDDKEIQKYTRSNGCTDWAALEDGGTLGLFKYERGSNIAEITVLDGRYEIEAWRAGEPEKKQTRSLTHDQAASIAAQVREMSKDDGEVTVIFDHAI